MKNKDKSKEKKKALENSITNKFMQAVNELGFDAEKVKKDVAKAAKSVSKKISSILKDDKKQKTQNETPVEKPAEKEKNNKKDAVKTASKSQSKTQKLISKAAANHILPVSSRSVKKPAVPAVDHSAEIPSEKEVVKEASPAVTKRKPASKAKKENAETGDKTENKALTEPPSPEKRKRGSSKTKTGPLQNKVTSSEITGSDVLR